MSNYQFSDFAHIIMNYNSISSVTVTEYMTLKATLSFLRSILSKYHSNASAGMDKAYCSMNLNEHLKLVAQIQKRFLQLNIKKSI